MNIGNYFEIENFSNIISNKIEIALSKENIFEICRNAFEFNFEEVQKTCLKFMIENINEIVLIQNF